jgi:phenylacetate-CoA ligase
MGDFFSILYITDKNIHKYIKKILSLKPSIFRTNPSFYDKLVTFIINNDVNIDLKIEGINLSSELCSNKQRVRIEKAFSTTVYFEYGHIEISVYAYTCGESYIKRPHLFMVIQRF